MTRDRRGIRIGWPRKNRRLVLEMTKRSREAAFERKRHLAWAFVPDGLLRLERKRKADDGDTC
jgi:hypothetical protein